MKVTVTLESGKHRHSASQDGVGYNALYEIIRVLGEIALGYLVNEIELVQDGVLEFVPENKPFKQSVPPAGGADTKKENV